jgi:Apea-like HEPN
MVGVTAGALTTEIVILGHGLTIPEISELSSGIHLEPSVPPIDLAAASASSRNLTDYLTAVTSTTLATFCLRVRGGTGHELVSKAWNALWLFHLLSLACAAPCFSLCTIANGKSEKYSAANRNVILRPLPVITSVSSEQIAWAKNNLKKFERLISNDAFSSAMRCYGNAHYLFDIDTRVMLLWAGIEGLLSVEAELSRRIALYTALLHRGTPAEKVVYFNEVRKAYAIRSRAVHGGKASLTKLKAGYESASRILVGLLARCVELGRVPTLEELDALAVAQNLE